MKRIKIIIADDHNLTRQSFAFALAAEKNFTVVDQAQDGKELLEVLETKDADIVILDLEMPVLNGWSVLPILQEKFKHTRIIVVSMHLGELMLRDLIAKGARGFLPKNSTIETLISAIYDVANVGYFFSKEISPQIVKELLSANLIQPAFGQVGLTEAELELLYFICSDKSTKEIAQAMKVTQRTVDRYKMSLHDKTQTKTNGGLVLYALKHSIFSFR